MKKIKLTQKKYALIDNKDFKLVNKFKWYYRLSSKNSPNNGYAQRSIFNKQVYKKTGEKRNTYIQMHNLIMNPPKGKIVDHINHNGLDNRKKNLRIINYWENYFNLPPRLKKNNFRGVTKKGNKFTASISYRLKRIYLGIFLTEKEAAMAYNKAAKQFYGKISQLNKL